MASIIKIKDNDGNIINIPAFVGPVGPQGAPGGVAPIEDNNIASNTLWSSQKTKNYIDEGTHNQPASTITSGTFSGQVNANATSAANLNIAQVRDIMLGTAPIEEMEGEIPVGTLYFTYKEV